jgi:formate-dependent nitrite reductase cytochrome c552 subunit
MPFGSGEWTADSQLSLCGQCHRHPSRAVPGVIRPENTALARFQPVGISQSKCYTKSAGAFSCVTCHDPHARASSDHADYEAACLRCHESPRDTACPVSPRGGCIDCHMPKVDAGQRVLFTDHWIRVRESPVSAQVR